MLCSFLLIFPLKILKLAENDTNNLKSQQNYACFLEFIVSFYPFLGRFEVLFDAKNGCLLVAKTCF